MTLKVLTYVSLQIMQVVFKSIATGAIAYYVMTHFAPVCACSGN